MSGVVDSPEPKIPSAATGSGARKRIRLAVVFVVTFLAATFVLILAEIHLRRSACYIVQDRSGAGHGVIIESMPDLLVRFTSKGKRLVPNARATIRHHYLSGRDISVTTNSLGFRDRELAPEKAANAWRILVLGDSITWGDYLQADEVYVERIEQCLARTVPNRQIEVINAGVGDTGFREQVEILKESGLTAQPDVVVVAFYLNDSRPPWGFPGELGHPGWLRRHSILAQTLYRQYKLGKWIEKTGEERLAWIRQVKDMNWRQDRQAFLQLAEMAKYDWGAAWSRESWDSLDPSFRELQALSVDHKFKVVLAAFPLALQVYAEFDETYPQEQLAQVAKEYGFYFVDILPILRAHRDQELFFDFCHPKLETNAIIGEAMAAFLLENALGP